MTAEGGRPRFQDVLDGEAAILRRRALQKTITTVEGVKPQIFPVQKIVELLGRYYYPDIHTMGDQNISLIQEWRSLGLPVIYMGNHLTNSDGPEFRSGSKKAGLVRGKSDEVINFVGKRLWSDWRTKGFCRYAPSINVWPPTETPQTPEEKRVFRAVTSNSLKATERVLKRGGQVLLFAEGGRAYDGQLKRGHGAIAHFLTLGQRGENDLGEPVPDTLIAPFTLVGLREAHPVGHLFPIQKATPTLEFLEPIRVSDLVAAYQHLPKQERQQAMIDHVMIDIAAGLPPGQRGVYEDVAAWRYVTTSTT